MLLLLFCNSAYGDPSISDPNDFWWVQVLRDDDENDGDDETPIKAINTRIRLLHSRICHLLSHNVKLLNEEKPQQEVVCMQAASKELSTWSIEHAYHEQRKYYYYQYIYIYMKNNNN